MNNLYPEVNDPEFNLKILEKKEFLDNSTNFKIKDVEKEADKLCSLKFELNPHQQFVKNYLSINTPYNSLLLYHGLGTGKTCSAITISEDMRKYMKQMGISKRIIIVASPNVQDNFRQQLFDDRKLIKEGNRWIVEGCSGNNYLKELNPANLKGLSKKKIINQVNKIINNYYLFMGYIEFANYISKQINITDNFSEDEKKKIKKHKLEKIFANRLIIIDEVHNIRISDDNQKDKRVARMLDELVNYVNPLRLLLLSATPMYNDHKEIIWLLNLMNKNDGRSKLKISDVFDSDGNFKIDERGKEIGKELLVRKSRGYISFLRGDNPYTFPYRIFPSNFNKSKSVFSITYPKKNLLGNPIIQAIEHLDIFTVNMHTYQEKIYNFVIESIRKDLDKLEEVKTIDKFGYTILQRPLEALNITYPIDMDDSSKVEISELVGQGGLKRVMNFSSSKSNFEYKDDIEKKYGRIFSEKELKKYSSKMDSICESIHNSDGISLIYSQYIDGGIIPLALSLEERGYKHFGSSSLFKNPPKNTKNNFSYIMITGDKDISPDNAEAVKRLSDSDNKNGEKIKVVIISRAGAEGLDFKNIRQIHILDPWYNTNRIEQIIGRGVRTCSHKELPFTKRNTMIFLYGTLLKNEEESVDMYIYRNAERKAINIGKVSRVLKENAIDCLLNKSQMNASDVNMDQKKKLLLSNKKDIIYKIGNKSFSQICDYMESCSYTCIPNVNIKDVDIKLDTYEIEINQSLLEKIKDLFKEHYFYKEDDIIKILNYDRFYSKEQIQVVLDFILNDSNELLIDYYGREGKLVNIGIYYFFQPLELEDNKSNSIYDKIRPINFKREKLIYDVPSKFENSTVIMNMDETDTKIKILDIFKDKFKVAFTHDKEKKKGDDDWYRNVASAIKRLSDSGMSKSSLEHSVLSHLWDFCLEDDKLSVLNYLYKTNNSDLDSFEKRMKEEILEPRILKNKGISGIFIQSSNSTKLYVLNEQEWQLAKKTDMSDLSKVIEKEVKNKIKNLNDLIGFVILFKDKQMVFKQKSLKDKGQLGARCDQAGKKETIKFLNLVLGSIRATENCSSIIFNEKTTKNIGSIELCCYLELILRCYDINNLNNKIWFLGSEYSELVLKKLKN